MGVRIALGILAVVRAALIYGDGADLAEAETMARRIGSVAAGAEIEVRHGGQPFYRYLISAE